MGAIRPRRVFTASFVLTVAACSKSGKDGAGSGTAAPPSVPFQDEWNVAKYDRGCVAVRPIPVVDCPPNTYCNPPMPQPTRIRCPPGATMASRQRVVLLADDSCAVAPEGCRDASCATVKTSCPFSAREVSQVERDGNLDEDGRCSVSWIAPGDRQDWFVIPCPAPGVKSFKVVREDLDAPCFVIGAPLTAKVEIPCPVEPRVFASGKVFEAEYAASKPTLDGKRVQVMGFYLPAHSRTRDDIHTIAVANAKDGDAVALTCTTTVAPNPMKAAEEVILDAIVSSDGALVDCAVWPRTPPK
jgi:hypothetical protein